MRAPRTALVRLRHAAIPLMALIVFPLMLVVGCGAGVAGGGGGGSATVSAAPNTIVIKNFSYLPASLTVAPGTKITVINEDQATHTLTADNKSFDTGDIDGGKQARITAPSMPGSYPYRCTIHQFMTGTLVVR